MAEGQHYRTRLSILNDQPSRLAGPELLHHLVSPSSDEIAIDFLESGSKQRAFTYRTLHALSDKFAQTIVDTLERSHNASSIVPVLLPQSPELYVVLLAILKAGKAFCPLGLDAPKERLKYILGDVNAGLLITDSNHDAKLPLLTNVTVLLADGFFEDDGHVPSNLPRVHTDDAAYVLYTSGSTGLPKAVSVSHRAITQSLLAHDRHIPQFVRFLQFAFPTFDVAIFEIFFPWFRGRTLVGRTRTHMLEDLPKTISTLNVDAAEFTPTVVANLLDGRASVPGLKLLLTIGEMLTRDIINEYGGSDENASMLWAMYGPTEAAIHCTLQPRISSTSVVGTIGYPLDTVSAFIVTPVSRREGTNTIQVLPIGEVGELAVGGHQIADRYLNRPELTAASFINDADYGCLYRTGDRARMHHDGTLECLGRVAVGQVKIRGQRVELGEVEQTLRKTDGCRAVKALVIDQVLVAFCATGSLKLSRAAVLDTCKRWLPGYMTPSSVCFVRSMPQLPSGKIDTQSLETLYKTTRYSAGSTKTGVHDFASHVVLGVLTRHLREAVTLDSELARNGLDSLQAIRVASALRVEGSHLTTMDVLSATTARDLTEVFRDTPLKKELGESRTEILDSMHLQTPEFGPRSNNSARTIPCTPLQEALLAETINNPTAYCNWVEIQLAETYTFDEIRNAVKALAASNEVLRSGFCPTHAQKTPMDGLDESRRDGRASASFNQIVWTDLDDSQIQHVSAFSRPYSLGSYESLLHPLSVQIQTISDQPRLLFRMHHALYDGWSIDLMLQDLEDILHGRPAMQRLQFQEVVRYYIGHETTIRAAAEQYWADHLRDRASTSLPNYNGRVVTGRSSQPLKSRSSVSLPMLLGRARDLGVNPQVFFQAATAYVMSLYIGSDDVVIGNVTSGRTIPVTGIEDIVGPCIASLPFRLRLEHLPYVRDILYETQRLNRESLQHCSLPLRNIAKVAQTEHGSSLFDVLFIWQQSLSSKPDSSLVAHVVDSADELQFKITIEYEPGREYVSSRATYDLSTVPEKQIHHLLRQIDEVVEVFMTDEGCKTSEIAKHFGTSTQSIANSTPRQNLPLFGLSHAVEDWAIRTPDKDAIVFGQVCNSVMKITGTITYAALNRYANQLARYLSHQGNSKDQLIAIIMDTSIDLYVAVLAVLKTGSGYLPLAPDTPVQRVRTILEDAKVTFCITDCSTSAQFRQHLPVKIIDMSKVDLSPHTDRNLNTPYNGACLAYAVFTSGSTGTPKGVLVTQENLMSNIEYLSGIYPHSASSRLLQSSSQAFDLSVFEIFFSWHVGITLCTAKKDDLFYNLEGAISQLGVTHLSLTPTVAALIDPDHVPKVDFLVTAGEAVTEHVKRKWADRGILFQGYGPSETTNICTVRPSVATTDMINNIGRPFETTSAFVLDPQSNTILPRGAVGELCFGGYQVFRGYLNRPDLNASKIIQHSIYGRIYRSGDMGVLLHDDCILFTGRSDDQVKIRGQRVELEEVTSALLDDTTVVDCVTLLVSDSKGSKRLVSFWVPAMAAGAEFTTLDVEPLHLTTFRLFSNLAQRLPSYMVPSHLVPISRLPMTAQAKVDKRLLQSTFIQLSAQDLVFVSQSHDAAIDTGITTAWDDSVAFILSRTLDLPLVDIKRTSSFFGLGLDSVSAIRFSNDLLLSDLGDFAISTILKNPTIALLATAKETEPPSRCRRQTNTPLSDQVFEPDEGARIRNEFAERGLRVAKILPCTPLQEAMLSSDRSSHEYSYINVMVFDVIGDLPRLQRSWAWMVQRHEILRTTFVTTNHSSYAYAQVVLEDPSIQWGDVNLQGDLQSRANTILSEKLEAAQPPVWLATGRTESSTKLFFCCHHALYDGIAVRRLLTEVQEAYYNHELPTPLTYNVYLDHMLSQDLEAADVFWKASLTGFEPTSFPDLTVTGKALPRARTCSTLSRRLQIPLNQTHHACQRASVSLLSMVQATWAKLLHLYTGENDVCFGNVVSGRSLSGEDLGHLVAPCFNTLPVRVSFGCQSTNIALVGQAHAFNIASLAHQLTPLRRIQRIALADRGGTLFDTLVILQQVSEPVDVSIWTLECDLGEMDLPLVCEIFQHHLEDALELVLHYHGSVLSETEAEIVADTYDVILTRLIEHPLASAQNIIGLPLPLQSVSNMDHRPRHIGNNYLHSGFEYNAHSNPHRTALEFLHADGVRTIWTYGILNEKANVIAHTLIANGVKPDDIIPIHIAKSPLFYASVLGVLKAGAAFVPIHPDLPDARKRHMFEELQAWLILVTNNCALPDEISCSRLLNVAVLDDNLKGNPSVPNMSGLNLAYCLFTSGSTGVPKAVSMEHHSPMQTIECSNSLVPWNSSSRLLQYADITFDMCYYDFFLTCTFGFTLCAAEQHMMLNDLTKTINSLDVDLLDLTPSVASSIMRSEVPQVKWLYCIGEAMLPAIVKQWEGACVNSFGPTETAFCTTIHSVSTKLKTSVIGRPFPSTSFAVFSPGGERPLPLLSVGELYIGGAQLARGYHGRSELTDEKFVSKCGQRFYRSGDVVRMLSDGTFEFIGRADDQVKIRGLRVELGEVNHVLQRSHPDIAAAVTQILKKDAGSKEQLVAFLVARPAIVDDAHEDIRNHLRCAAEQHLPAYMIPQFFLFIEKIPISMAGKIDRKALADIFKGSDAGTRSDSSLEQVVHHRWSKLESQIRNVLAQLSKTSLQNISPSATIYQLGLDSISAVQIATSLRRKGYPVSAADVMRHTSCVDLANYLTRAPTVRSTAAPRFDFDQFDKKYRKQVLAKCNIDSKDLDAIRPCTPLQRGMISQFLAKDGTVYLNYLRLRLHHDLDFGAMREAWNTIMKSHPILRTGFVHLDEKEYPFVMVHYGPDVITLPWRFDNSPETIDHWLQKLQRRGITELHRPLWEIRPITEHDINYLDIAIFHPLFDAHSLQIILRDVVAIHRGELAGIPISLEPVVDAILHLSSDHGEQGTTFWTNLGNGASTCRFPNLASLKLDPVPPEVCVHRSAQALALMKHGCQLANTTLQAAGIASWLYLLSAYTGEREVACGVVLSGRTLEAVEDAVFPCINTVPFVHTITADLKETLTAVTALNADIQQHQHVPLSDIQRSMGFPNEALFDTIFAYQRLTHDESVHDFWSIVDEKATIEYPVSIELEPRGEYLEYRLTFLPHLIPRKQAALILAQFDHLIGRFIVPEIGVETFDKSLYSITPAKETTLPSHARLLHELVELTTVQFPQRIAFEFAHTIHAGRYSGQSWTYSELDTAGNQIAHLLITNGVQPGDLVGVCFDKCPEASFAMLGVLKAGCAFVAIDPGAPAARQKFSKLCYSYSRARLSCLPPSVYSICDRSQIFPSVTTLLIAGSICIVIQDSGASAVLSMAAQSFGIRQDVDVPLLNLDEMDLKSLLGTKPALQRQIIPQDRSYCLYTSGTTGTPKGCELTHENAVQALLAFQRIFAGHWNADSRMLQFAFFHFDVSVLEQFWSWSVGIRVVSAPRDVIFEDLVNSINTLGITHIDLTPSLAQLVHPDDVPSLCKGVFITGGESLKQEILDVWGSKSVIYNGYGPTEATIGVTMYPRVPINGKSSNIGWQFDNVGTYVLQPGSDVPLLRGGIGELIISGKLVGKGYLNREALTSRSFPYLERFKERVYRTGDLVRVLHDGSFEFLGRADDQVKLRGQRLEIGEINTVIRRSSARVSDVATLVLKHPKQQKEQLVTFVVLQTKAHSDLKILWGESSTATRAREACHDKLPPYMVPTHFITLGSLPLNINNKADTKRLKELYQGLSSIDLQKLVATSSERAQSLSQDEQQLRKVLGAEFETSEEDIGRDTSFFELGMDSISVIGVVRALKQAGFVTATASLVMSKSTFRRLSTALASTSADLRQRASLLAAQQAIHATQRYRWTVSRSISAAGSEIEALAPCTSLQQGMIARYLESNDGMYFNTFQFELSDQVDLSRLRAAWQTVYALAQALRTVFVNTEDGYVQAVLSNTKLPLTDTSIQDENESLYESLARLRQVWLQCNNADLKRPFEITHLITPSKNLLVVRIFHGLYDGISIELIFRAVWKVYNGAGFNKDAPSYHSALAYGPLRNVEGAKKFWQNHLMSNPSTSLPPSAGDSGNNPARVIREINLHATFESTRRTLNVTAKAIAQAVWVSVLSTHIQGSAAVGMVVSGRSIDLEGADRVLGPMFNTIPYRHRHQTGESWLSIIKRVHDFNVAAHPFQHTPLRDIMKWCQRDRSQALFDSLFVYQAAPDDDQWARNEMWELIDGNTTSDYPVAFEVEQRTNNRWKLTLVTQAHISDESTSNALLDQFETAIHQAIVDPTFVPKTSWQAIGAIENSQSIEDQTRPDANDHTKFEWTDEASFVREQLARLAGTAIGEINESTSIFELGLDSIDAIKLSSKLKKRGVDLPVSGIMRGLTIAGMTSQISWTARTEQALHSASTNAITHKRNLLRYVEQQNLDTNNVEDVLPLTPLQEAMVADMVASDFTRYYNIDVMKLDHGTEVERLRDAWTQVVSTSPILRTSFVEVDDPDLESSYVQLVHSQAHNSFWALVTMEEEPDFPKVFQSLRYEARIASSGEPPFHILLIQAPEHIYLVLSIAHALYDGWSLALLHADVKRAFEGHHEPRPDYQPALMEIVTSSGADAASFWRSYLENSAPTQFPRRSVQVERIPVVHRLENSSTLRTTTVTDFVKKSSVSLQTLGQAVFAVVLASYTRSLDVTFGSILSGRDDATTSQLLFPTMNAVAIRAILHGSRLELLRYVQDSILEMKRWQHFPLRKALALTGVHERLLGSLFIYQKSSERDTKEEKQLYKSIDGHSDVEYPVCVEMEVVHGEIIWRCAVKEEIFDADGARELLGRLHQVMEEITRRPDKPVIDFTPRGISVCELPPFLYDEETELPGASLGNDASPDGIGPNPQTLQVIRQILAAVSGTSEDDITNDMSIFHTGLDSISAMKVCSLLRKKGIVLSVGEMLRAGSVENMARVADANSSHETEESEDYIAVRATTRDLDRAEILRQAGSEVSDAVEMLPVTAGQLYMLSMWINTKGSNFYVDFPYTVIGSISFSELKSAWKALVAANPILRSMFIATRDLRIPYAQVIPDAKERELAIVDVTEKTGEQISEILKQIETQQPFVGLLVSQRLEPAGWDLKLKIHHALYDGVSLPILIHQLQDLCNGVSNPSPSSTTFARYIASSHTPSALSSRKAFWTQYLASISQHDRLPQPDPSVTSRTEIFRPIFLPSRALESTARQNGLSVHSLFLAAYARQYASFISNGTPQPTEVIVGIYLANRSGPICGIEDAAVPTVNLLPLRITSPLSRDVINIACQVQSDLQRISESAHACASLFEIHEWTGVAVDTFVNFLTFPNADKGKGEASGVAINPKNGWGESVSRTVEQVHEDQRGLGDLLEELRDERVGVAYLHAIDVEATVRNGALDVGIFAPTSIVDLAAGERLVGALKIQLESIGSDV